MTRRPSEWTAAAIPDQTGRVVVITGANSGIGLESARALAARGATVVLACRSVGRAQDARASIMGEHPAAVVDVVELDLASLSSVRAAARSLRSTYPSIDLLINNAAAMWTPRQTTVDGFELQFATNHLGHFALTGLLIDLLEAASGARIVVVGSRAHREGRLRFTDLQMEHRYGRHRAYARSKLANLMFAYELARRLQSSGSTTRTVAAHPGAANTDITRHAPGLLRPVNRALAPLMTQTAARGALPILRAATDPDAVSGDYFGPSGFAELRGAPVKTLSNTRSHDVEAQRRLFAECERLTGVSFPI